MKHPVCLPENGSWCFKLWRNFAYFSLSRKKMSSNPPSMKNQTKTQVKPEEHFEMKGSWTFSIFHVWSPTLVVDPERTLVKATDIVLPCTTLMPPFCVSSFSESLDVGFSSTWRSWFKMTCKHASARHFAGCYQDTYFSLLFQSILTNYLPDFRLHEKQTTKSYHFLW
jgi:hypothetical protein